MYSSICSGSLLYFNHTFWVLYCRCTFRSQYQHSIILHRNDRRASLSLKKTFTFSSTIPKIRSIKNNLSCKFSFGRIKNQSTQSAYSDHSPKLTLHHLYKTKKQQPTAKQTSHCHLKHFCNKFLIENTVFKNLYNNNDHNFTFVILCFFLILFATINTKTTRLILTTK